MKQVAKDLIAKGRVDLALRLHKIVSFDRELVRVNKPKEFDNKVVAFDTRFNMYQDGVKCLYLLDSPIYDYNFECIYEDGHKELMSDKDAAGIITKERDFNEKVKEKSSEQLKRISKFSKMGNIKMDPLEELKKRITKEAPEIAPLLEEKMQQRDADDQRDNEEMRNEDES